MRIDIAIYTAQEGHAWQPGSAISMDELREYKTIIGKFPSPDNSEMPFGGIFLKDTKVVFYRYHVAKRIDFLGRDALYCALGTVSVTDASQIVPRQLFSLPEFAGPMRPFPSAAELPACLDQDVPEWLKNLDVMSLDVRITGTIESLKFAVQQACVKSPPVEQISSSSKDESTPSEITVKEDAPSTVVSEVSSGNAENSHLSYADVLFSDGPHKTRRSRKALLIAIGLIGCAIVLIALLAVCCVMVLSDATTTSEQSTEKRLDNIEQIDDLTSTNVLNSKVSH